MADLVRYAEDRGIATVTLDSPENRNALSTALVGQLAVALERAFAVETVRAIVLTGSGSVFCSGADLREQLAANEAAGPGGGGLPAIIRMIRSGPKPVVARVNGHARAGGIGLIAAADIAIAPETATFAFSEVRIGVVPAIIAVPIMERVGRTAASDLFLTGRQFDGTTAASIGLIARAVPAEELDGAVEECVGALRLASPAALAACKELIRTVPAMTFEEALDWAAAFSARLFQGEDAREGMAAFLEKRKPRWQAE
ncbi:enoyl-CoA hydratase-related protein [Tepidiforma thermophila]|uniref:Methylglutaconyl-CoA hydratase n=1 Tax=Tepidiforma thermophila (strain KCTC 52669 / CGMCC 1.13589 / G233) TaxID=2761530 RepID=A0A2A9HHQ8_TEPT2|nr:enoyl-CoA hydratase-related protein [Tepidiforma thermophila]PFG74903.1 methylglutaconyl-CoA hydratase [Tepidiforma thermophila]